MQRKSFDGFYCQGVISAFLPFLCGNLRDRRHQPEWIRCSSELRVEGLGADMVTAWITSASVSILLNGRG